MRTQKEWLLTKEVAKEKKIGLPFVQFGPRIIKYNRLDIIKYIEEQKK